METLADRVALVQAVRSLRRGMMTISILATLMLVALAAPAYAGTIAPGHGDTFEEAKRNADYKAVDGAKARGTCVSRWAEAKYCAQPPKLGGKWECRAAYANHKGSCEGQGWQKDLKTLADMYKDYQQRSN